jgi:hypothetical protein
MTINVKLTKDDSGVIIAHRDIVVYGEFHIDKIKKWLWELQIYLNNNIPEGIPESPQSVTWSYEVNEDSDKVCRFAGSCRVYTMDQIKQIVEDYYKKGLCQAFDITDYSLRKPEVVEMRNVAMAICLALTDNTLYTVANLYGKRHCTAIHAKRVVVNGLSMKGAFRNRIIALSDIFNEPELINKINTLCD